MPVIEGTTRPYKVARAEYDFAVDGGAIGTITLRAATGDLGGNAVPSGATVLGGYIDVSTAVAQAATGTLALGLDSSNDVFSQATPGLTVGRKSVTPAFTGATTLRTTAVRSITFTIGVIAVTAGKLTVVLFYH